MRRVCGRADRLAAGAGGGGATVWGCGGATAGGDVWSGAAAGFAGGGDGGAVPRLGIGAGFASGFGTGTGTGSGAAPPVAEGVAAATAAPATAACAPKVDSPSARNTRSPVAATNTRRPAPRGDRCRITPLPALHQGKAPLPHTAHCRAAAANWKPPSLMCLPGMQRERAARQSTVLRSNYGISTGGSTATARPGSNCLPRRAGRPR
jgi:hypothetical protein